MLHICFAYMCMCVNIYVNMYVLNARALSRCIMTRKLFRSHVQLFLAVRKPEQKDPRFSFFLSSERFRSHSVLFQ